MHGRVPPAGSVAADEEEKPATSPPLSSDETFDPWFPAECNEGPPVNMRGMKYAPDPVPFDSGLDDDD